MRFIDPTEVELACPNDWQETVERAMEYVNEKVEAAKKKASDDNLGPKETAEAVHKARSKAINSKSNVWSEAGKILRQELTGKCWYCETDEVRSDMPVDHFRPKNRVDEADESHPGYWWLAFDWMNYRVSCTFCNSRRVFDDTEGGKHDHFPLMNEADRAFKAGMEINERPMLLDPCDIEDVDCLTFIKTGQTWESNRDENSDDFKRANKSIELYHLNEKKTVRERKLIAIQIRDRVQRASDILDVERHDRTSDQATELKKLAGEILGLVRSEKRFSTAARVYLSEYRKLPLVESILKKV